MKKIGLVLLLIISLSILSNLSLVHSASLPTDSLEDKVNEIDNTLNTVKNPEDLKKEIQDKYLKEQWNELIAKNKFIGPIHNQFMANQWFFQILFREKYAFSLTFIATVILWIFIVLSARVLIKDQFKNWFLPWLLGILVAMGFAWSTIINKVVNAVFNLIYAQSMWWARLILWIVFAVIVFLIFMIEHTIAKNIRIHKMNKEKTKLNQDIELLKARNEGKDMITSKDDGYKEFEKSGL